MKNETDKPTSTHRVIWWCGVAVVTFTVLAVAGRAFSILTTPEPEPEPVVDAGFRLPANEVDRAEALKQLNAAWEADYGQHGAEYETYLKNLNRAIEEGWDWDWIAMRVHHYIDEGLPILCALETGGDAATCDAAIGDDGEAVGRYQIHPIMVEEANRILGKDKFSLADRSNRVASAAIARTYLAYWMPRRFGNDFQPKHMPFLWNGGSNPRSWGENTEEYARRFMEFWVQVHGDEDVTE